MVTEDVLLYFRNRTKSTSYGRVCKSTVQEISSAKSYSHNVNWVPLHLSKYLESSGHCTVPARRPSPKCLLFTVLCANLRGHIMVHSSLGIIAPNGMPFSQRDETLLCCVPKCHIPAPPVYSALEHNLDLFQVAR